MGGKSSPAPAPVAPAPVPAALPETPDASREGGARGAARRLEDLGQPPGATVIEGSGAGVDPLGNRKVLTGGSAAMMS